MQGDKCLSRIGCSTLAKSVDNIGRRAIEQYRIAGYFPQMQIFLNFPNELTTWENKFWDAI